MTKEIKLDVISRSEKNGNIKKIRDEGFIPANLYGSGVKNTNLKIKTNDFLHTYKKAGESQLIDLKFDNGSTEKVIIKEVQKNPVKDNIIHIDFYKVDMKKKIVAEIPLNFIGEPKAVKELGGILLKNIDTLEVNCLPGNLVEKIDVDLSGLNNFHDAVKKDSLNLPEGMELTGDINEVIASVVEPIEEEVIEKKEEEETEGEEGKEEGEGEEDKKEEKKEGEEEKPSSAKASADKKEEK